jgi:hypothetical protein
MTTTAPTVRVYDTGAPRGERNHFYVEVNGRTVFGSANRRQVETLAAELRAALKPQPAS